MKYNHVMIDLETMATTPNCAIVSIGAVIFEPRANVITDGMFYEELDWECQDRYRNKETMKWWAEQSNEARSSLAGLEELKSCLEAFARWLPKDAKVWGNGSIFDIAILEDAYRQYKLPIPWKFWNVRDMRTIKDLYESARGGTGSKREGVKHHALHDAIHQAKYLNMMWSKILR